MVAAAYRASFRTSVRTLIITPWSPYQVSTNTTQLCTDILHSSLVPLLLFCVSNQVIVDSDSVPITLPCQKDGRSNKAVSYEWQYDGQPLASAATQGVRYRIKRNGALMLISVKRQGRLKCKSVSKTDTYEVGYNIVMSSSKTAFIIKSYHSHARSMFNYAMCIFTGQDGAVYVAAITVIGVLVLIIVRYYMQGIASWKREKSW